MRESIKGMELEDVAPEFNLGNLMPKVVLELSKQKIHKFDMKETKSI